MKCKSYIKIDREKIRDVMIINKNMMKIRDK